MGEIEGTRRNVSMSAVDLLGQARQAGPVPEVLDRMRYPCRSSIYEGAFLNLEERAPQMVGSLGPSPIRVAASLQESVGPASGIRPRTQSDATVGGGRQVETWR